jgi:serine protease Do
MSLLISAPCQADSLRETPVVKVIQKCAPMVVNISTERTLMLQQNPFWGAYGGQLDAFHNNNMNQFTQNLGTLNTQSLGSGVLVSADGLIVTNAHVAGMASKIFVTLQNGETKEAVLIGTDNQNDLALIQIPAPNPLPHIELADNILIGETVVSIGNPLGLQNSVSSGIVSGTGRTFTANPPATQVFRDLIQTDASINQGSSGGALINLEGKLVGVNFAVVQNAQGLGFAVPSATIQNMLLEYQKYLSEKKK